MTEKDLFWLNAVEAKLLKRMLLERLSLQRTPLKRFHFDRILLKRTLPTEAADVMCAVMSYNTCWF